MISVCNPNCFVAVLLVCQGSESVNSAELPEEPVIGLGVQKVQSSQLCFLTQFTPNCFPEGIIQDSRVLPFFGDVQVAASESL